MGSFRFRKSVKIAPGLRLNINKKSVGISTGVRGARYSINSSGRRSSSVGIPGTGLSYRTQHGGNQSGARPTAPTRSRGVRSRRRRVCWRVSWDG